MKCLSLFLGLCAVVSILATHRVACTQASHVNRWFINDCEEKCVCKHSYGFGSSAVYEHTCYREREEFTCMSTARRQRFLDTYVQLSTLGNPQYAQFKALVLNHGNNFGGIHITSNFLPWHRWFSRKLEDLLRNIDCRVTLPWWRWSKKSATWQTGSPFLPSTNWLGHDGGGSPACVANGPFSTTTGWVAPKTGLCLKRNFSPFGMPTTLQITNTLAYPSTNYPGFTNDLEWTIHNLPHGRIGGNMVSLWSPDAPEFFLHHGYIDQLWDRWQRLSLSHLNAYSFGMNTVMPHTWGSKVSEVNDLDATLVKYVNVKSSFSGSGHWSILPKCLWIKLAPHIFSLEKLIQAENKWLKNPRLAKPFKSKRHRVHQRPFEKLNEKELVSFRRMYEKIKFPAGVEQMYAGVRRVTEANKEFEEVQSTEFNDEASREAGFDVAGYARVLGVGPEPRRNKLRD